MLKKLLKYKELRTYLIVLIRNLNWNKSIKYQIRINNKPRSHSLKSDRSCWNENSKHIISRLESYGVKK